MKTSIVLIGFMGTGKTTVGKALAKRLGKDFVELDRLIEQRAGKPIPRIFDESGETGFRELEITVARETAGRLNSVIACGGGIVLNQINIDRLRQEGVIVYLTASPEVILKRVSGDAAERPLLRVADPAQTITELLKFRQPFYERAAEITVNTSKMDIAGVVGQIVSRLKERQDFSLQEETR